VAARLLVFDEGPAFEKLEGGVGWPAWS
jgi:hypothetical protein